MLAAGVLDEAPPKSEPPVFAPAPKRGVVVVLAGEALLFAAPNGFDALLLAPPNKELPDESPVLLPNVKDMMIRSKHV